MTVVCMPFEPNNEFPQMVPSRQDNRLNGWSTVLAFAFWLGISVLDFDRGMAAEESTPSPKLVVVLYPHNSDGSPGNFQVDQSVRETFASESRYPIEIYNEYLDFANPRGSGVVQIQQNYLKQKYAGRQVDLGIAALCPALDFVLEHRDVFSGAPIVYCCVDFREIQKRKLPPDVIGIPCQFDLEDTLKLALQLHPGTENVAVIVGSSSMDLHWEKEAKQTFRPYEDHLKFTYLTGHSVAELQERVADLPPRTVIYYIHVFRDAKGKTLFPSKVLDGLVPHASAPIYSHVNTYVSRGIVGGRVFRFSTEGENAALLGLRVLAGEKPERIDTPKVSQNVNLFDDRQLKRWKIDRTLLPEGSIVQFQEPGLWEQFQWQIIGITSLVIVLTGAVIGLLIQRANWHQAEARFRQAVNELQTSQNQLRQLSDRLIEAQEQERCRIAGELHDDFNQVLALLAVKLDLLRQKPPEPKELDRRLEELSGKVQDLSSHLHELSHELHPLKLEQLGLTTAVRSLCKEISDTHDLTVHFTSNDVPPSIPPETALCLYRIVQESLRNVLKHSGSVEAHVTLVGGSNELTLQIADGGTGFDPQDAKSQGGLGFLSMRERLRSVGGRMQINSQPGQGAVIKVLVPIPAAYQNESES